MGLTSARLNTPRVHAAPHNEHERHRAAERALPPPFSPRAAECSREKGTRGFAQHRLDENEDYPAAGPAERVGRNGKKKPDDHAAPIVIPKLSPKSRFDRSAENKRSQCRRVD